MDFNLSCDLTWPPFQRDMLKFLIVNLHFSKFCDHKLCDSSDTAAKIVYVTSQDHVIKGSGDFMERNSSLYIPTLLKLIVIEIVLMNM